MFKNFWHKIIPFIFPVILVVITVIISYFNYTPGTFLTGWDTLHPEFNFVQQFSNEIFGVFRTDQGLGAVAAHAHMSELPRVAFLWLESFIFPLSFLRYSQAFLCFILGPLGIYYFVKKILSNHETKQIAVQGAAFIAALVYIFNLEVVQQFYVPFEMFLVQYAALGWIFLFTFKYLTEHKKSNLLIFAILMFLASPMAYASVLWFAFFGCFVLFLITYYLLKRNKKTFKAMLILIAVTLLVNAYWILPNMYFLATTANSVSAASTNKIFSDEAFLYNKQYGNIFDTAIFKNFLFSWTQQITPVKSQDLLIAWKNHLVNPFTLAIGYLIFAASIFAIFVSFLKKNKVGIALTPFFILSLVMVMNMNPPFEIFFSILRDNVSLFKEGLRFPFTKFAPLLIFVVSIFVGISASFVMQFLSKIQKNLLRQISVFGFILLSSLAIIWYGFPMFQGQLIDPQMRISIPNEYFQFFDYMKNQPENARVAPLPLNSMWGWEYYNWTNNKGGLALSDGEPVEPESNGYQGAGFLWFGIKQPVLARDFDRWNPDNEQYFREMSTAIYSRDSAKVEALSEKYKISYFLLDESEYSPGNNDKQLWHYETMDTFDKSNGAITLVKKFGNDLYLYKVNGQSPDFVQKPSQINIVGPATTGGFVDLAAEKFGDYVVSDNSTFTYPQRSLVDRYDRINPASISFSDGKIILKLGSNNGGSLTDSWLNENIFPSFMRGPSYDLSTEEKGLPYTIGDDTFFSSPVTSPPSDLNTDFIEAKDCGGTPLPNSLSQIIKTNNTVLLRTAGTSTCGYVSYPSEKQDFGSILLVEAKNESGLPLRLCISNKLTGHCDIYTSLDSGNSWKQYAFMIPPQPSGATGYEVHFNNVGIGQDETVNEIRYIHFMQVPYYRLENLSFVKNGFNLSQNGLSILSSDEINPLLFRISYALKNGQTGLVSLDKAYDKGWQAYKVEASNSRIKNFANLAASFIFGERIEKHVETNDWSNGWIIDGNNNVNKQIVIIYIPQYLEYAGIILTLSIFVILGLILVNNLRNK